MTRSTVLAVAVILLCLLVFTMMNSHELSVDDSSLSINPSSPSVINRQSLWLFERQQLKDSNNPTVVQEVNYNYCQAEKPESTSYPMPQHEDAELINIQLLTRHGDRTAVNPFPFDSDHFYLCTRNQAVTHSTLYNPVGVQIMKKPILDRTNSFVSLMWSGNCVVGQLTDRGAKQLQALGQSLRSIYIDKLQLLKQDEIERNVNDLLYVRSTDIWRTQQSALHLLNGLLYSSSNSITLTIPLHTFPIEIETLYPNAAACPNLAAVDRQTTSSAAWLTHMAALKPIIDKLRHIMHTHGFDSWQRSADHYFDNLMVRRCHSMPPLCSRLNASLCVTEEEITAIQHGGDIEYELRNLLCQQVKTARLAAGGFLEIIRGVVKQVAMGSELKLEEGRWMALASKKMVYYSVHDSSIGAVLGAFNITGWRWPPYASNLLFELWRTPSTNSHFIRLIYNGELLTLPFADSPECPLDQFVDYLNQVIPDDLLEECHAKPEDGQSQVRVDDEQSQTTDYLPMSKIIKDFTKNARPMHAAHSATLEQPNTDNNN